MNREENKEENDKVKSGFYSDSEEGDEPAGVEISKPQTPEEKFQQELGELQTIVLDHRKKLIQLEKVIE